MFISITVFLAINNTSSAGLDFIQCPNVLAAKIDTHLLVEKDSAKLPRLHILEDGLTDPVLSPPSLVNRSTISFWHYPSQEIHTLPFGWDAAEELDPQVMHYLLMNLND